MWDRRRSGDGNIRISAFAVSIPCNSLTLVIFRRLRPSPPFPIINASEFSLIIMPAPPSARTHVVIDHDRCSHLVLSHYKPLPPFWPPDITPALTTTMFELAALFENPTAFGRSALYNSRTDIFLAAPK